jgi:hypothetical protein
MDRWSPDLVRQDLKAVLAKTRRNRVELILKDITTVRGEPQRLWQWAAVASEVADAQG